MAIDNKTEQLLANALGGALSEITPKAPTVQTLSDLVPYLSGPASAENLQSEIEAPFTQLGRQLAELTLAARAQAEYLDANTRAVAENSLAKATNGGSSTAGGIGRTILSILGGGFGLGQLLGNLFGGGNDEPVAPALPTYALPPTVQVNAAVDGSGLQAIRYGSDGLPRAAESQPPTTSIPVTIQVQAIDSQSFKDHSSEIASAVREALLHSHSLNDVVLEL